MTWIQRDRYVIGRSLVSVNGVAELYYGLDTESSDFQWHMDPTPNLFITNITFVVTAGATVGTRRPSFAVIQPGEVVSPTTTGYYEQAASATFAANQTRRYQFQLGTPFDSSVNVNTLNRECLPEGLVLLGAGLTGNGLVRVAISNHKAGDASFQFFVHGVLLEP